MKSIADFPEVAEAREKLNGVTDELGKVEREQHNLRTAEVATAKDDVKKQALRFLSGQRLDDRPQVDTREKRLGELHQKETILRAAFEIASAELTHAEQAASAEIMKEASAEIERLAQDFATSFSEAALKAELFKDLRTELEDGGINVGAEFPAIALGRLDIRDRDSWVNRVLTDLENDYRATIDRSVLEAKETATEEFNAAEAKISQMAGRGYAAGPEGVWSWLKGGKRKGNEVGALAVPPAMVPGNPSVAR